VSSFLTYAVTFNLSYFWNLGSILIVALIVQIITGICLTFRFSIGVYSFESSILLMRESFEGFFLRVLHLGFASFLFFFTYLHLLRGLLYGSYRLSLV
jgi:quinol-cytochrome oxidoreductase complex cytochrome b subunit